MEYYSLGMLPKNCCLYMWQYSADVVNAPVYSLVLQDTRQILQLCSMIQDLIFNGIKGSKLMIMHTLLLLFFLLALFH